MITTSVIPVRYPDLDPMGIVHHAVYPLWYEIARMQLLEEAGFPWSAQHELGIDPVMVNLTLDYLAPVRYPGEVTVKARILLAESKKLKILYECYAGETCVNRATSFHIWCRDMKSVPLAQELPELYAGLKAACENE